MAELKDSGTRREFDTGAVRDMAEGKGRCDLLPLDAVAYVEWCEDKPYHSPLCFLHEYQLSGDIIHLRLAINLLIYEKYKGDKRNEAYLELAKHFEDGARKYGDRNWEKGIPTSVFIDSAIRHYFKYKAGWTDEPHYRACLWNLICCLATALRKPALESYPIGKETKNESN